jgi:putative DNA primase/helicase
MGVRLTLRDQVQKLISRGFSVVPIPARAKGPTHTGWQHKTFSAEDFSEKDNVGVFVGPKSSGLVDVDLDCDEAVTVARFFLPATNMRHGRPSRPNSHHWYKVDSPPDALQLKDSGGKMLVELRSAAADKGFQTMVPPSVHPSEERLTWDAEGEPSKVPLDALVASVRHVAAAAQLARAFPQAGRHAFCLALSGVLLRSGMPKADAERFVLAVATAGGSSDPQARAAVVSSTADKLAAGEAVTGLPTLTSLIQAQPLKGVFPGPTVDRFVELLGIEIDSAKTYTEVGIAEAFVAGQHGKILFIPEKTKWAVFGAHGWEEGEVTRLIVAHVRKERTELEKRARTADEDEKKILGALIGKLKACESHGKLTALEALSRVLANAPIKSWDADPYLFAAANGVLDLRTGAFTPFSPDKRILRRSEVPYSPGTLAPRWRTFLAKVIPDQGTRDFLQAAVGYSMSGSLSEQVMLILYGTGANGKSTFLEVLRRVFGTYAANAEASTFTQKAGGGIPNDLAALAGARFVTSAEVATGAKLAESLIKRATGGDPITARFLRAEFFEYTPAYKLWMSSNSRPLVDGQDRGIWRRIRLVPFTVSIPDAEQDHRLKDKLLTELPGILEWALEGCLAWQQAGLPYPEKVREASEEYREDMDTLADFFSETTSQNDDGWASSQEVYQAYVAWHATTMQPGKILEQRMLTDVLSHKGFVPQRKRIGGIVRRGWQGISLKSVSLKAVT